MYRHALVAIACLMTSTTALAQSIAYPQTRTVDQVDEQFGVKVADPYRWLENDVRNDPEVAAWVAAQNKVTDAYLATLPGRDIFKQRLTKLFDYERFGVPAREGGRYFYSRNSGLQNQSVLYVRDSLNGQGRVLIDPNGWSKDGATALAEWAPSKDGKRLLYSIQDGGSDWRKLRVLDVDTGKTLDDQIDWVKYGLSASWVKDGSGFYYARFPTPEKGQEFQSQNLNAQVYFHKLGTPQSADRLIYERPDQPRYTFYPGITDDGRWLVISTSGPGDHTEIAVLDLTKPNDKPRTIVNTDNVDWSTIGSKDSTLYLTTTQGAPRLRIVTLDMAAANPTPKEVVAEDKAVLNGASLVGGRIMAAYLVDAKTEVKRFTLDGKPDGSIALPGIGTVGGVGGELDNNEGFFAFSSFATPTTIYRYDVATRAVTPWATPKVAFDPAQYDVRQRFYASKDGTKVPMFIVKRKDVKGPAPTLLYAYGGFNVPILPGFSAGRIAWLEQGGVLAVANIRGGSEYGKEWHDGGKLLNKQNVFDDFIGAGEDLIAQGVTSKGQLAIQGGSNGGLLVGAVVNQRPDLFAAALPAVGVMDMLRFDRFTAGRYWVDDYGVPAKEADFRNLLSYSPYHNVKAGVTYPAILATTADTDDRVVPGHTFKYTAMIQSKDLGPKPHLVRIETRAGHGSGKPTDKVIEETADLWAFIAKWTGMQVKPIG